MQLHLRATTTRRLIQQFPTPWALFICHDGTQRNATGYNVTPLGQVPSKKQPPMKSDVQNKCMYLGVTLAFS